MLNTLKTVLAEKIVKGSLQKNLGKSVIKIKK